MELIARAACYEPQASWPDPRGSCQAAGTIAEEIELVAGRQITAISVAGLAARVCETQECEPSSPQDHSLGAVRIFIFIA
jgi:hypothetical protein